LLTDDNWYETHDFPKGFDSVKTRRLYEKDPPKDLIDRWKAVPGNKRPATPEDQSGKRVELDERGLVIRDDNFNVSRRLTEEELRQNLEVIPCRDHSCSAERKELGDHHDFLFVPGSLPATIPSANLAVTTTATTFSTALVSVERPSPVDHFPRVTEAAAVH